MIAMKICECPFPLNVASGMRVDAKAEWGALIPLANGSYQAVQGLALPQVTNDMPILNLTEALRTVQQNNKQNKDLQNLRIPSSLGKSVDMILGQRYQQIHPKVIHTLPNGLTIYKSKLQPWNPGETACIGGPIEALEGAMNIASTGTILRSMANLIHGVEEYRPKLEYFPDEIYVKQEKAADQDIPKIEALEKEQNKAFCSHFCSHTENV